MKNMATISQEEVKAIAMYAEEIEAIEIFKAKKLSINKMTFKSYGFLNMKV